MTPKEVVEFAKSKKIEMVDLKFMDFVGTWQHFAVPIYELQEDNFEEGFGFDGSSIRGWQPIHDSDMLVIPDADTAIIDPFIARPTLSLICNIVDPITKEAYSRDPRNIARKAEAYLKSTGIADAAFFGPEAEFFIFDDIRYATGSNFGYYYIDSEEGVWNTGREEKPNLGYKPRHKEGYFPVPPTDSLHDLRDEMVRVMESIGLKVEAQHHEVATAGQAEIDLRFDTLVKAADAIQWYKYIVKNVARKFGKTVTFMPKPLFADNGSGMHTHQSLWKGGKPLFAGEEYGGLSRMALHYIGGILKHASAICAFSNPDDELLQAARPRVRGAGEPGVLEPEPVRRRPDPDVLGLPEGEAPRVPDPRPVLQRVHRLRRDAHGGPRRRPEQEPPRGGARP